MSTSRPVVTHLLQKCKELLTSPYGVAAIASLSFHGILFAAVPRFSSASFAAFSEENATSEPRTVPLVTLSPAEQGRLPNFNRPQLPSVPEFPSSSSRSTSIRNLPSASTLTPRSNIFNRYSGGRTTSPSITRNRRFNNPYSISITETPSRSEQSNSRKEEPLDIPPPPTGDQSTLEAELEIERQQEAGQAPPEQEQASEGLPVLPEDSGNVLESEDSDVALNPEAERQLTQLERLQAKFTHSDEDTTEEEVVANYEQWEAPAEGEDAPAVATADKGELQIESGFNLCVANPPTNGEVGVLVAPDGTPTEPVVLRRTGYDYLNQVALDAIAANDFPETETAVRYPFDVVVDYDAENCQSSEGILNNGSDTASQDSPEEPSEE